MAGRRVRTVRALVAALALVMASGPSVRAEVAGLEPEYRTRPPLAAPGKRAWEQEQGGREAAREALWRRLEGWPAVLLADRDALLALSDQALLERIARDTWRGLAALTDREHGLPMNHVLFAKGSLAPRDGTIGDYASATDIGIWMIAVVAAHELALIGREEALARLGRTLDSLDRLETSSGFLFNYYDTTTLERTSDFVSFVDASWLATGLVVARQGFPELAQRCGAMLARRDFGRFYDRRERLMVHGFYVEPLRRSPYHYGMLYAESRLGSLVAIGKGDVSAAHWQAMTRVEPWSPDGRGAQDRPTRGSRAGGRFVPPQRTVSGYFEWQAYRYVPSWGGSMFEALMPMLVVDELRLAPYGLGPNARVHVAVQQRYALDHLGYPVWGMSPSWRPDASGYQEYGVRVLGVVGYPGLAVTPHAAALALMVDPVSAIANLRELIRRYPIYGDFGFYDAVAPRTGEVAHAYLVLDQAMILAALANHLRGGAIQQRFAADPIARRALPLLAEERFPNAGPHLPPAEPGAR